MSTTYFSAQKAAEAIAEFFSTELRTGINLREIRELQDSLTVVDFYLKIKRREIEWRLLDIENEYQRQVLNGYMGDHLPSDGAGPDYELPSGERDGQLVEVIVRGAGGDSASSMRFG